MKGNFKRVIAASALLIAVLMIVVSIFPGSVALAAGGNGNGGAHGNHAPYVQCVNGRLILNQWMQDSGSNRFSWHQADIGSCPANTEAILNQLASRYGMTRAQLDALIAVEFGAGGIPQNFDLQTWFTNFMAGRNGTNNGTNNNTNNTTTSSASTTGTNQSSTTGTNQSSTTSKNQSSSTGTKSNGGIGGASAPSTLPTTGGELSTVSPLVLALGALLVLFGAGVYKVSATR